MKICKYLLPIMAISLITNELYSQSNREKSDAAVMDRRSFLIGGYNEIKEDSNFGLVFAGPRINYGMIWNWTNEKYLITYEFGLGTEILFSHEIPALGFYLKPIQTAYLFNLPGTLNNLYIGPSFTMEYQYNLYPDLQSGFDYWFTDFNLGIDVQCNIEFKRSVFNLKLISSLIGVTSRTSEYRNPYFYDIGFNYAVRHLHEGFGFGTIGSFNSTSFEILWKSINPSRIAVGYMFQYSGYFNTPEISLISNSLKLVFSKKSKSHET